MPFHLCDLDDDVDEAKRNMDSKLIKRWREREKVKESMRQKEKIVFIFGIVRSGEPYTQWWHRTPQEERPTKTSATTPPFGISISDNKNVRNNLLTCVRFFSFLFFLCPSPFSTCVVRCDATSNGTKQASSPRSRRLRIRSLTHKAAQISSF